MTGAKLPPPEEPNQPDSDSRDSQLDDWNTLEGSLHSYTHAFRNLDSVRIVQVPKDTQSISLSGQGYSDLTRVLTPFTLSADILPLIEAIFHIQRIIGRKIATSPRIVFIGQSSPVNISLTGIPEAYKLLRDDLIPWRRAHQKAISNLEEQKRNAEVFRLRAESDEIAARTKQAEAEAARLKSEAKKMQLQYEKDMFELRKMKIDFIYDLVLKLAPNASHAEKLSLFNELLPQIETVLSSPSLPELNEN